MVAHRRRSIRILNKKRITILGGGIASLSAAYELTSLPNWQDEYEINVYQTGWRLGGKMASGRGPNGRVEEVGLHLLLGFYEHAFPMFADVYRERTERGLAPHSPFRTLQDAIVPNNATLLVTYDTDEGRWINWPLVFPTTPGHPGDGSPLTPEQLFRRVVAILLETALGSPYEKHNRLVQSILDRAFAKAQGEPPKDGRESRLFGAIRGAVRRLNRGTPKQSLGRVIAAMEHLLAALGGKSGKRITARTRSGRMLMMLDFGLALAKGIAADVWDDVTGSMEFRRINDRDLRGWLRDYGASEATLFGPIVTFFYTGTFEALADNQGRGGLLAAGTALQFGAQALGYKGAFCYQLRLGTADTLIMPMYEVLAARGVKFHFFHKVANIAYTSADRIDRIEIDRQVKPVGDSYDPRIWIKGNPCWPAQPLYEQLDPPDAARLREGGIDLESPWSGWKGESITMERGRDFDDVILGIPAKALAECCTEIIARREDWRNMVERLGSARVMSAQLWFGRSLKQLGFELAGWGMGPANCVPNVVTYANPLFSWLDQSQIVDNEDWPADSAPKTLAMFTGILPDEPGAPSFDDRGYPLRQDARVREMTFQWLMDHMGFFLRNAVPAAYPQGLDLSALRGRDPDETDPRVKFADQFFTSNSAPTNQYMIALPGTERYRLRPDGSGFSNLYLVGDWTDYGVNIGYMEGCVVSAKTAVGALLVKYGHGAGLAAATTDR
ncbi:NAD(P)-binding protein [Paenibacillus mesophilus]|uniref:NAD(P)-binding protein n=1 Tax=Paenibacillus mesophilus TaxID=2582849 RepID=UPI0013053286|nr:NAD(P)-binding protein [Paenibacillus mesophilus]